MTVELSEKDFRTLDNICTILDSYGLIQAENKLRDILKKVEK